MKVSGNTILITGGGSGIGRGLAEAFHKLGNHVIVTGRRQAMLDETTKANPGMKSAVLDIEDPETIKAFAAKAAQDFPTLNVLINNAGIMKLENVLDQDLATSFATINTNLLGPVRLTAALLPLLQKQASSTIMTVSSGLAFVPLAPTPIYCATEAAIHFYTQSLRYQLRSTTTEVLELIPPYVATDLMGSSAKDPRAMPLDQFIAEVMQILQSQPTPTEICVERVKPLRFAAQSGKFDQVFNGLNEAMADRH